jgi:hypothetical protein
LSSRPNWAFGLDRDIVETGTTLRETTSRNERIAPSSARLIANVSSYNLKRGNHQNGNALSEQRKWLIWLKFYTATRNARADSARFAPSTSKWRNRPAKLEDVRQNGDAGENCRLLKKSTTRS